VPAVSAGGVRAAGLLWRRDFVVFLGFAAVSFGYFGWSLLPHPGRVILGAGQDNEIFVWSFAWWPHAILSWTNPFVTHALYAPSGANLVWTTSVPGLALVFSPLTLLLGPVVSFNAAALLIPALSAWAAYRLCFVLTGSMWASLIGGYLFGFSSFVLAQQMLGHIFLTADFVLPLIALSIVRFIRGEWSRRRLAVRFGVLMALQLSISTEVALTLSTMLVVSLVLAFLLVRDARPRVRTMVSPLVAGYCLGAVFAFPLVIYALLGFPQQGFIRDPGGTDLLNLVFPSGVNAIAGTSFPSIEAHFDPHDDAIFVGVPALLIVALFAWRARRSRWARFLVAALVTSVVFALGPKLRVDGHAVAPLPWRLVENAPGFEDVSTPRFGEYTSLALAVIVALWAAQARGWLFRRPYVLPTLAVAVLVPAVWRTLTVSGPQQPAFFTAGLYKGCIPPNETLAIFPFGSEANILQADAGFAFRVAGGYLTPIVFGAQPIVSFNNDPVVYDFDFYTDRGLPTSTGLLAFAARHNVDRFVSIKGDSYPTETQMRAFGPVEQIGGVYIAPACGTPSLTARPQSSAVKLMLTEQRKGVTFKYCLDWHKYNIPAGVAPAALLQGATLEVFVAGHGLTCEAPPGYTQHGLAPSSLGVPANTYPYYTR
jgi:hypothetical protein